MTGWVGRGWQWQYCRWQYCCRQRRVKVVSFFTRAGGPAACGAAAGVSALVGRSAGGVDLVRGTVGGGLDASDGQAPARSLAGSREAV